MPAGKFSVLTWPGDGSTLLWPINFSGGYISKSHVKAYMKGASEDPPIDLILDWIGDYTVKITPPVPVGKTLTIYRDTPKDVPIVNFSDDGNLGEDQLNLNAKQAVFIAAEFTDKWGNVDGYANFFESLNARILQEVYLREQGDLSVEAGVVTQIEAALEHIDLEGQLTTALGQITDAKTVAINDMNVIVEDVTDLHAEVVTFKNNAAGSATAASTAASSATTSASAAATSASAAATTASGLAASVATDAGNAAASASTASSAASTATTAASNASSSLSAATTQAGNSAGSASSASSSATAAAGSASAAASSASGLAAAVTAADGHKNAAATYATNAATEASNAAGSASSAAGYSSSASSSSSAAGGSASAAASSATSASSSASAAAGSASSAATHYTNLTTGSGSLTAQVSTLQTSYDGISARYVVRLDATTFEFQGFELGNGTGGLVGAKFNVTTFSVTSPYGDITPFVVDTANNRVMMTNVWIDKLNANTVNAGNINYGATAQGVVIDTADQTGNGSANTFITHTLVLAEDSMVDVSFDGYAWRSTGGMSNATVRVFVNGSFMRQDAKVGQGDIAKWIFRTLFLTAGSYTFTVDFQGDASSGPSSPTILRVPQLVLKAYKKVV